MNKILYLNLKAKWYDMIESGFKKEEYREIKDYWIKRLDNKAYDKVCFIYGYTKRKMLFGIKSIMIGIGNEEFLCIFAKKQWRFLCETKDFASSSPIEL